MGQLARQISFALMVFALIKKLMAQLVLPLENANPVIA